MKSGCLLTTHCVAAIVQVCTPLSPFIHPLSQIRELDLQQIGKGLVFNPKSVWFQSLCVFHYNMLPTGTSTLPVLTPKVGKLILPEVGVYLVPGARTLWPLVFLTRPPSLWLQMEAGRQGDSLDSWKGRMDGKLFQRRSLFSDYSGII